VSSTAVIPRIEASDATVDAVVAGMREVGCTVVEGLLDDEHVRQARADLEAVLEQLPLGRNDFEGYDTQRVYAVFAKTRAFDEAAIHPLVLGVLDEVIGPGAQFSAPVGINIGAGEKAQVLHRDDSIYPLPWPHDEVVVNTMWALEDFTEANGATRVVPGSHRWPTPDYDDDVPTVTVEMDAGSVIFYPGNVLHGGGANRTNKPRLGVILEYVAGWLRPQENHVLGVPPDVVRDLPERLQELLGYNVYPPFVGYVDGRHPRKFLDRT
jgi:ectoine hydroxylase-related dioxygenase (phytanoyl-CoA dioxygenase family)